METISRNIGIYLIMLLVFSVLRTHEVSLELETENFYSKSTQISNETKNSAPNIKQVENIVWNTAQVTPISISLDSISEKARQINEAKLAAQKLLRPDIHSTKILMVGDSMIQGAVGVQIENKLMEYGDIDTYRFGKPSTGMSRPDFFNWNKKAEEILKGYSPEVAIIMFGANDGQSVWTKTGWVKLNDANWEKAYEENVRSFSQVLYDNGVKKIYWIGNSISRYDYYSEYMSRINNALIKVSANRPSFVYISTWEDFSDDSGNYIHFITADSGSKQILRAQDGIHFTNEGGKIIADKVIEVMKQDIDF